MSFRVVCDGCGEKRETPTVDRDAAGMPQVGLPAPWRRIETKADDLECDYYVCSAACAEGLLGGLAPFAGQPAEHRGLLAMCDVCQINKVDENRTEARAHWTTVAEGGTRRRELRLPEGRHTVEVRRTEGGTGTPTYKWFFACTKQECVKALHLHD